MNRIGIAAVIACIGCTGGKATRDLSPTSGSATGSDAESSTKEPTKEPIMKPSKQDAPKPTQSWVQGPSLASSASELISWFEAQKRGDEARLTRISIVMQRGDMGFDSRGVKIGTGVDPVEVFVTDAALGIGISSRARSCTEPTCAFIVEGYWRGKEEGGYHYEIRTASRHPISAEELAALTHAEVEGESGN